MYLPGDLIPTLLSFMDQETLARMASTCKAWKLLVHRSSVWSPFTWKPRTYDFFPVILSSFNIARHLGSTDLVCFLTWIVPHVRDSTLLPQTILTIEDPKTFVRTAYKYWLSIKTPCRLVHHHRWSDVCTLKQSLATCTSDERYTIKVLLVNPCNNSQHNEYVNWIEHRILDIESIHTTSDPRSGTASTLLQRVIQHGNILVQKRLQVIQTLKNKVHSNYETSRKALLHHSIREFKMNDMTVRTRPLDIYDAAILSYAKDS